VLANRLLVAQLANLARLVVLALFGAPRALPRLHDCLLRLARRFHLKSVKGQMTSTVQDSKITAEISGTVRPQWFLKIQTPVVSEIIYSGTVKYQVVVCFGPF
jgi:hypothetical protein